MGAGAGAAAAIENEPSPRRAAIEKAQAELRREVAVREERRRELEFLEKGGELLDFFSAASLAFPPPPIDPLADQLLPSGAEGGHVSVPIAKGDSLENIVGTSCFVGRISGGGDRFDVDDNASAVSKSLAVPREGKGHPLRTGSSFVRSQADVSVRRESDNSGAGRTGGKGQAYSRRNRARSNRFGNGYISTRVVEKATEHSSTPSLDCKGHPVPLVVTAEASRYDESTVEKNAKPLLVHLGLPNTSDNWASLGSAKVSDSLDGSAIPLAKLADHYGQDAATADLIVDHGELSLTCGPASTGHVTLSRVSDSSGVCTDFLAREDLPVGPILNKLDHFLLSPCPEETVDVLDGRVAPQALEQVLPSNQDTSYKEGAPSMVAKDESSIMLREKSSVFCHVSQPAANSDCKSKLSTLVTDFEAETDGNIHTSIRFEPVSDPNLLPNIINERCPQLDATGTLQFAPVSLASSWDRSNSTRKTSSTASSGALDVTKTKEVKALKSAQVDVKVEDGFLDVETRLSAVGTEVEAELDIKSGCVASLLREEILTPVLAGAIRSSFRNSSSLTASNKFPGVVLPWEKEKDPNVIAEAERHKADLSAKAKKAHEDYILEEAEIIKAVKKETAEWEKRKPEQPPLRRKSHWDFVLEEMAWMANDFMQERLWKMASASQFCRWIAELKGQSEFQPKDVKRRQKKVAHLLATAVNEFWRSLELSIYKEKGQDFSRKEILADAKDDGEVVPMEIDVPFVAEASINQFAKQEQQSSKRSLPVQRYAKCFLRVLLGNDYGAQAEAPSTPERTFEPSSGLNPFWEEQFPEESLVYVVPNGALSAYRNAVEADRASAEAQHEQTLQEHETALAEAEAEAQAVAEAVASSDFLVSLDESESLTCLTSPTKGRRADEDAAQYGLPHNSIAKKKRKNILKSNSPKVEGILSTMGPSRPLVFLGFDTGGGLPSPLVTGKRSLPSGSTPANANVGSIPTKRMRSGTSRQRSLGTGSPSSFSSPAALINRTPFSSGALTSNHEEGHNIADCAISTRTDGVAVDIVGKNVLGVRSNNSLVNLKSKKKKKTKHFSGALGSSFKVDGAASGNTGSTLKPLDSEHPSVYDRLKRKGDQLQAGSNEASLGGIGSSAETPEILSLQGQQPLKKAKLSRQVSDVNIEAAAAAVIAVPVTQAGPMVAMTSSTSKLLRQNSNRDRNRKSRSNKVFISQPAGIGIPWSTIEDQAILALVHDLGQNWELVSDVLSSSSQLKGIFRRPKQCKERHKALMDRLSVGEGCESPDDPSTSQPHPSTLPGIPKGSARVLLQRLQGPMEEDTLKVHLEHIVRVVQKFHALKPQNEEQKIVVLPHPSHISAVSQFCNSGLTGGLPTPLELCDLSPANPDVGGPSYQIPGPHLPTVLPSASGIRLTANGISVMSGISSLHMGVPAMGSSSAAANAARDVHRLAAMRPFSPEEEAQRVRYARAMAAARGLAVPGVPATAGLPVMALPSPSDCTVPMLAAGNGAGMIGGLSRSMSLSRASLPGMGSPGVSSVGSPTLGTMLPPGGVGMGGTVPTVSSSGGPNQVNLMRRPRDQMVRPGRTSEEQRQLFIQELQQQAAQGNTEAQTALTTLNRDLTSPLIPAPTQNFASQQHQTQQQQQYITAARMVKERQQLQHQQHKQRLLQQQLQQPTSLTLPLHQQQLHPMPQQQHVLAQQSQTPQHQHLLPQPHALQKQQSQQGVQQPGLPLASSCMQAIASSQMPSNHQTLSQPQSQPQQQSQSSGQVPQLSVQSKLQPSKQSQKHQHLQQSSQPQQQQPRGSKGVVRGAMMMQTLSSQTGLSNILPGSVTFGNQITQQLPPQSISHPMPSQRPLQPQGLMSIGKQISQGITGQTQQTATVAGCPAQGSLGQQQKVLQQPAQAPLAAKQQPSPLLHPLQAQQPSSTPGLSIQQPLSPPGQQTQIAASQQSQPQPRRQTQQQPQMQQSGQRRLQQRQQGSNIGVPVAVQPVKNGSAQQGQGSPQMAVSPGHMGYPVGSGSIPGTSALSNSSIGGLRSNQWKSGQNASPMSAGLYNLTRSGNSAAQLVSSSGMHVPSPNGSTGMSLSSSTIHTVSISGPAQSHQSIQGGSGVHVQSVGGVPETNARAMTSAQQGGALRPSQHHGNLTATSPLTMGEGQSKLPVSGPSCGIMSGATLLGTSTSTGAEGAMAFQGDATSASMFGLQPRQPNPATAALNASTLPQKPATPTTANLPVSASPSSPVPVTTSGTAGKSINVTPTSSP